MTARSAEHIHREVLPNGLTILVEEVPGVRSAALGFWVRTGSVDEPAAKAGATHFIEHLLFKRTRRRTNQQIAELIDRLGGDVDAFTSKENTVFYARVEGRRVPMVIDLLADIVRSPMFDAGDFERERKVVLEEISMVEDTPDDLIHELFVERFWKGHPLSRPVLGTPRTIQALSVDDVAAIHRSRFVPGNLIFAAAGDVDAGQVAAAVRERFGDLGGVVRNRRLRSPAVHPHITVRHKKELEQVQFLLGFEAPAASDPLRYAATLLNVILGGGVSSRLFVDLREKRGLVYSCGSFWSAAREGGYECVYAATRTENLGRVLAETLRTVRRMVDRGPSKAELERAKENVLASFVMGLESTSTRMSALARHEFNFGRSVSPDEIIAAIEAVDLEHTRAIAKRLFQPESLSAAFIGPLDQPPIELPALRKLLAS